MSEEKKRRLNIKRIGWRQSLVVLTAILVPLGLFAWYTWSPIRPFQRQAKWLQEWRSRGAVFTAEVEPLRLSFFQSKLLSPDDLKRVKLLSLGSGNQSDTNMDRVMQLEHLEGLVLHGTNVKKEHVETLSNHPSLKLLVLSDTLLNDVDLRLRDTSALEVRFCDQKPIRVLEEMQARIKGPWGESPLMKGRYRDVAIALARLSGLVEVERVDLRNCVMSREALESCSGLEGLKYFSVGYGFDNSMVDMLLPLKSLEELDLSQSMVTDEAMNQIVQMSSLKILTFGPNMGDESMRVLEKCKALDIVHCGFSQVSDAGIAALASSPTLRGLDLSGRPISGQSFDAFAKFAKLQELSFSNCINVEYDDYKKLANIRRLKRLSAPLPQSIRESLQRSAPGLQIQ